MRVIILREVLVYFFRFVTLISGLRPDSLENTQYYKQLLDEVFVISGIIKVKVSVMSRSRRLRLITLTETLIIPDITKTESNNCFIIHCFEENNDKRIIAYRIITVYFQTLKNVQLSDKQIFTVFIKQSSAEKLNAFLKKVSLKKTVDDQTDECLASLNVFNHKKFS